MLVDIRDLVSFSNLLRAFTPIGVLIVIIKYVGHQISLNYSSFLGKLYNYYLSKAFHKLWVFCTYRWKTTS